MPSKEQNQKQHSSDMTTADRKKTRHPIYWVLSVLVLALIAVSFLVGPALGSIRPSKRLVFGYYDGEPIEFKPDSYFSRQRDMIAERVQQMQENNNRDMQWQALQVWKGAYDQTVVHTAILQQADKSGLHFSDKKIDKELTQFAPYMENGEFSPEAYRNTPNSEKQSNRELVKENLIHQTWMSDYTSLPDSSGEKAFLKGMASPERKFTYTYYSINDYPASEVREYANANEDLFRNMRLSRISLKMEEAEAEKILSQLENSPERFEELARNHSTDSYAEKGGDMGPMRYHEILSALEKEEAAKKVFSLSSGETSGLLKTSFGWSIYRCDEEAQEADLTDEETISEIRSYIISNERGTVEDYFLERASTIADRSIGGDFTSVVQESGKEAYQTGFFPINYGGQFFLKNLGEQDDEGILGAASNNERVLTTLFSIGEEEVTEPFVLGTSIVVAQATEGREAPDNVVERIDSMYSYLKQNYYRSAVQNTFLDSEKHESNFMKVFSKNFMNNNTGSGS